jgi:hypothetical protein
MLAHLGARRAGVRQPIRQVTDLPWAAIRQPTESPLKRNVLSGNREDGKRRLPRL